MTTEQLSVEVYEKLVSLNYARKPNSFGEATVTNFDSLSNEVKEAINSFPSIYIHPREDLMNVDSLDGKQQFYLVENELGAFLIDNQGYNYPRYITELVEYVSKEEIEADEFETFERMDGLVRISDMLIFESVIKSLVLELKEEGFERDDISNYLEMKLFATIVKTMKK